MTSDVPSSAPSTAPFASSGTKTGRTRTRRTTLIAAATAALMTFGLGAASAHVSVTPDKTAANSYSLLTFSVGHGCDGSATTSLAISLPNELVDATPTVNPNWTISKVTEKLAEPRTLANGSSVTERTSQIVYTAKTPLDPHQRDAVVLSVQLPDAAGKTLYFPTLQTCEVGQTNWAAIPADGQDPESIKDPAPGVAVSGAVGASGDPGASQEAAPAQAVADQASANVAAPAGSTAPGWIGLVAGLLGLVLGGVALARTRGGRPKA
ncbi:MAG: nuclear export factor [Micrococcaceae bacterium]|nr:nuclear export factor [Micrococcaceae bacterium]